MIKDLTKIFIDEIYDSPPERIYETHKTIIKIIDNCWSSDLLDANDYKPANIFGNRYILLVFDKFTTIPFVEWTIHFKKTF